MSTPDELVALSRRWLACFESHDVDTLVALYAPDARHTSPRLRVLRPETGGSLVGRDALRAWWADAFRRLPGLRYVEQSITANDRRVFMEYRREVPGEPASLVAEVLEVEDGFIVASRVYPG